MLLFAAGAYAQNVTAVLKDAVSGDPVGYATVSLTRAGQTKPTKYVLSTDEGKVNIESVRKGEYVFKAELLGYKPYTKTINMESSTIELGEIKLDLDTEVIDAASVSAVGNPIIIKKDTIEYNASSFKTNDNDMLEDLLKKLPGIEVSDSGSITINGQAVNKITIDGKTFFLDDPELASKNIPAKLVNKLKVIQKKSDQAEFTGIDDGQEEQVIDLSVQPGMMNGLMGNVQAAAGHDIPSKNNVNNDFRYQSNAFIGKFTQKTNISLILNANNANSRGSGDRSGAMMGAMMGGGMPGGMGGMGGGGLTTSYMGGLNLASEFFEGKMNLGGNYMYNHSDNLAKSDSYTINKFTDHNQIVDSDSYSSRVNGGHNFGIRLEHQFSKNANIIFEPQVNFGGGSYVQSSNSSTVYDGLASGSQYKQNEAVTDNVGENKNMSASSYLTYRQRLGLPGRTLTVTNRLSFSNNDMTGFNWNNTRNWNAAGEELPANLVDQYFTNNQKSTSVTGRLTYTEPLGNHFYIEADYQYNYSKSVSDKETFNKGNSASGVAKDPKDYTVQDYAYSNNIINENSRHDIGANILFQMTTFRAQLGFTARPTHTFNSTSKYDMATGTYSPMTYTDDRWNFSPEAMVYGEMGNNSNGRIFYRGNSSQPSTSQLMPVPDNTNPLSITFGNPALTPYFSHNFNGQYRYNNRQKFTSFNIRFNGGFTQNPITNAIWNQKGVTYSMPFNGKTTANAGANMFFNTPIAKSNFSINNQLGANWSTSWSYVGEASLDMSKYADPHTDFYAFMEAFVADHPSLADAKDFRANNTQSLSVNERIRLTYRLDNFEIIVGGSTRMSHSWYTVGDDMTTWNNAVNASVDYDWNLTGLGFNADLNYNWYRGYATEQPHQFILNAEITKLIFHNRATLAIRGYDLLGQSRNLSVTDNANRYAENITNSLGRYIVAAVTFRFGTFGRRGGFGGGRPGGPGMGPGMGGGRPGGMPGGGRPPMGGGMPGGRPGGR